MRCHRSPLIRLRIDSLAHSLAERVETENEPGYRKPGEDRQVRRVEQVRPAAVQHRPPAWRGRLNAETEETERRLPYYRTGHAQRCLNDDRRQHRRHDMAPQDLAGAGAQCACGLDILELTSAQRLPPDKACVTDPADQRE